MELFFWLAAVLSLTSALNLDACSPERFVVSCPSAFCSPAQRVLGSAAEFSPQELAAGSAVAGNAPLRFAVPLSISVRICTLTGANFLSPAPSLQAITPVSLEP